MKESQPTSLDIQGRKAPKSRRADAWLQGVLGEDLGIKLSPFIPEGWLTKEGISKKIGTGSGDTVVRFMKSKLSIEGESNQSGHIRNFELQGNEYTFYSPEIVSMVEEHYFTYDEAPEGWLTLPQLAKMLGMTNSATRKRVDKYKKSHEEIIPEGFQEFRAPTGHIRLYMNPLVIEQIARDFDPRIPSGQVVESFNRDSSQAPEGWSTVSKLRKKWKAGVSKMLDEYKSNPSYFGLFRNRITGKFQEHVSPELVQIIEKKLMEVPTDPPEGWITIEPLSRNMNSNYRTIKKIADEYRPQADGRNDEYADDFGLYRTNRGIFEYVSPKLVRLIRERYDSVRNESVPEGWKARTRIGKDLGIAQNRVLKFIQELATKEDVRVFCTVGNKREYFSPRLVSLIETEAKRRRRKTS